MFIYFPDVCIHNPAGGGQEVYCGGIRFGLWGGWEQRDPAQRGPLHHGRGNSGSQTQGLNIHHISRLEADNTFSEEAADPLNTGWTNRGD